MTSNQQITHEILDSGVRTPLLCRVRKPVVWCLFRPDNSDNERNGIDLLQRQFKRGIGGVF